MPTEVATIGRHGLISPPRPSIEQDADGRLALAHRTLLDGATFIGLAPRRSPGEPVAEANLLDTMVDVRLLGNGLRELDRFLGVLIEEVATRIDPTAHDPRAFARLRNTANKLRLVRAMMNLGTPDHRWLCAVGRLRVCLHHCGGELRRPGHPEELALAGCRVAGGLPSGSPRGTLVMTSGALDQISRVYRRVGDDLVTALGSWKASLA